MTPNDNQKCPSCGAEQPADAAFCGECGAKLDGSSAADALAPPMRAFSDSDAPSHHTCAPLPLDDRLKPLTLADYLIMIIAFAVPLVGLILMIVWSVSESTNINRKNFSRAMLIVRLVSIVLSVIAIILFAGVFAAIAEEIISAGEHAHFNYGYGMSVLPYLFR